MDRKGGGYDLDVTVTLIAIVIFIFTMLALEQKLESSPDEYAEKLSKMISVPDHYWVYVTVISGRVLNAEVWKVSKCNTATKPVCTITCPLPARLSNSSARRLSKAISSDFQDYLCND